MKSNVDFYCRRCRAGENGLFQTVLLKEVVIEPNVKLECVPKFCYLGDTLGAEGGVEEAARAGVRCAWAKFKEISPILTARGASYRIKGKIYKACVQSVLAYGTDLGDEERKSAKFGEDGTDDGEMDVRGVAK